LIFSQCHYCQKNNLGFDYNIKTLIELCETDFLMFLSSDDAHYDDCIINILNIINSYESKNLGVIYVSYDSYDKYLLDKKDVRDVFFEKNNKSSQLFNTYIELYNKTGFLGTSLISCLVINKKIAIKYLDYIQQQNLNSYIFHNEVSLLISKDSSIYVEYKPLIKYRTENTHKEGYFKQLEELFGNSDPFGYIYGGLKILNYLDNKRDKLIKRNIQNREAWQLIKGIGYLKSQNYKFNINYKNINKYFNFVSLPYKIFIYLSVCLPNSFFKVIYNLKRKLQ
jgi:hypothetical protein